MNKNKREALCCLLLAFVIVVGLSLLPVVFISNGRASEEIDAYVTRYSSINFRDPNSTRPEVAALNVALSANVSQTISVIAAAAGLIALLLLVVGKVQVNYYAAKRSHRFLGGSRSDEDTSKSAGPYRQGPEEERPSCVLSHCDSDADFECQYCEQIFCEEHVQVHSCGGSSSLFKLLKGIKNVVLLVSFSSVLIYAVMGGFFMVAYMHKGAGTWIAFEGTMLALSALGILWVGGRLGEWVK